jgi:hypothetical protein
MTHDLGDRITPLMDDAVAIDDHAGALVITSRLGSVHTVITVRDGEQFTRAVNEIDIAGVVPECVLGLTECNVRVERGLFANRVTCIGER